jgi:heme oxygenase
MVTLVHDAVSLVESGVHTDLLSQLRAATYDLHQRVEEKLTPQGPWTVARYCRLLQGFEQIVSPVEPSLGEQLGELFVPPSSSSRTECIRADLRAMGCDVLVGHEPLLSPVKSRAEAFGVSYVLQGSLLGGAIIVRHLRRGHGGEPVPARYLDLYGDGLSFAWKRFRDALNAFGESIDHTERRHASDAAIQTFLAFDRAFDRIP